MARMLIIGLDGADPALAARWMEAGVLPNLRALARAGALLPLRSTMPPATFPAWTTCATGVNPGRHGAFHQILDGRLVQDGQHLFRLGFGRRQETRPETGHRKNRFFNLWHILKYLNYS